MSNQLSCHGVAYDDPEHPWRATGFCQSTGPADAMYAISEDPDSNPTPHCETCARRIYSWTVANAPIPVRYIPSFESYFETWDAHTEHAA